MLSTTFFQKNRKKLKSALESESLAVVTAQSLLQRSADTTFPFRQDSSFFYLTGIEEPDVVLVISAEKDFLILPKRSEVEAIFGGSIDVEHLVNISGIDTVYAYKEGWAAYKKIQSTYKKIYTLGQAPPRVAGADSFFTNPARRYLIQKLKRLNPAGELVDLRPTLSRMRQVKQPEEIEAIKQAIVITKEGFITAKKLVESGAAEYEIEAEFDRIFKINQANHGYQPIVAGGERACVLHYIKNDKPIKNTELCLLDVGAEHLNYSADITRTYGRNISSRQQEVINAVAGVQNKAIEFLQPGKSWKEYAQYVEKVMGEALVNLGLMQNTTKDAIKKYFPHGISHSLGLDVHDVCDYKIILENMVITVEPGIYIPEEGIGVRIEDNTLITKDGALNLSKSIPYV